MPVARFRGKPWGSWVDVKEGASERLAKEITRAREKGPVTIFMSSSTDPYQPAEYQYRVTRSLLESMNSVKPDFLFVQTRSPLIARDIDLLLGLKDRILISITVETDLEPMRKAFTPAAPPIAARLRTLKEIAAAGLPSQAAVSPILPCSEQFPELLADIVERVCLDDYFLGDGSSGKRTERLRIKDIYTSLGMESWYDPAVLATMADRFRRSFAPDRLFISRNGFLPPSSCLSASKSHEIPGI